MSKKTESEEMLMRVFRVAELLTSSESSDQEKPTLIEHPLSQIKKGKDVVRENTKH
jgi:hypothetical protein